MEGMSPSLGPNNDGSVRGAIPTMKNSYEIHSPDEVSSNSTSAN